MKSKITLFLIVVMVMVIFSGICWAADTKVLKLSHLNPQQPKEIATAAMTQVFKSMVESGTNNEIVVEIYPVFWEMNAKAWSRYKQA